MSPLHNVLGDGVISISCHRRRDRRAAFLTQILRDEVQRRLQSESLTSDPVLGNPFKRQTYLAPGLCIVPNTSREQTFRLHLTLVIPLPYFFYNSILISLLAHLEFFCLFSKRDEADFVPFSWLRNQFLWPRFKMKLSSFFSYDFSPLQTAYVYVHICVHACVHVFNTVLCVSAIVNMYVYTHTCVCTNIHIHVFTAYINNILSADYPPLESVFLMISVCLWNVI